MAYSIQFAPETVLPFLRDHHALDRAGRVALFTQLHVSLAHIDTAILTDPSRRLSPGSACFWFYAPVRLVSGDVLLFRFAVSDAASIYGILRVVYVDDLAW